MSFMRSNNPVDFVVGSRDNFWLWSQDSGWDLTHPPTPNAEPVREKLSLECSITNVTIDPLKTALLIVDMQNLSMSRALGVPQIPAVFDAQETLLRLAIPAARKANIQIIWLNWGLTEADLESITPAAARVFGWTPNCGQELFCSSSCGERPTGKGPGADLGEVVLEDGRRVSAGRALMRSAWNTELHGPLLSAFHEGQGALRPDLLIHKNRNSGLYDTSCDLMQHLVTAGIRTLLFTGMNTDQCVMSTLQDAHHRGFDTIMLKDACATDSPDHAQRSAEFNCCVNWGFLSSCKALAVGAGLHGVTEA